MKKVLITGCSGLVGTYLIKKFLRERYHVIGVDINEPNISTKRFSFEKMDLTKEDNISNILEKYSPDVVINAFGIKGSPIRAKTKPVDFLYPSFKINTELIHQCYKRDIWLVFMSSVGVYAPAEKFVEDDVWKTLPSEHDWFPSWSKRTGELLLEAYKVQYGYDKWSIIRPANIFGEYDDFSGNGTVISTTIKKIWESEGTMECWGDGSPTRDFVFGADVADAIYKMYENKINDIVNFGSGEEITIKSMIDNLVEISGKDIDITWDSSKPNGDLRRQMDVTKQKLYDLLPSKPFVDALKKTYYYYVSQFPNSNLDFNVRDFLSKGYYVGNSGKLFKDVNDFNHNVDLVIKSSNDKSQYLYRYEYGVASGDDNYKRSITLDEIPNRDEFIKNNNAFVIQKWWETHHMSKDMMDAKMYFRSLVESYVPNIYPDLKDNILHQDNFTLYENGDFITPHQDGYNAGRYCVVLIYLSDENDYIDGGGKLIIDDSSNNKEEVLPVKYNFSILDFTENNVNHAVEVVKNNFRRFTYIDFIYNDTEYKTWQKQQNII